MTHWYTVGGGGGGGGGYHLTNGLFNKLKRLNPLLQVFTQLNQAAVTRGDAPVNIKLFLIKSPVKESKLLLII